MIAWLTWSGDGRRGGIGCHCRSRSRNLFYHGDDDSGGIVIIFSHIEGEQSGGITCARELDASGLLEQSSGSRRSARICSRTARDSPAQMHGWTMSARACHHGG